MTRTMKRLPLLVAAILIAIALGGIAVQGQDPKAKGVLEAIKVKTSQIKEFTCVVEQIENMPNSAQNIWRDEQGYRAPDLFYIKKVNSKHIIPNIIGMYHIISDGKQLAVYTAHPAGSGGFYLGEKFQKLPEAERTRLKREHETPKIEEYDFARLRQGGVLPEKAMIEMGRGWVLIRPMHFFQDFASLIDINSMQLISEDNDNWQLECRIATGGGKKMQIAVNKQDGLVRRVTFGQNIIFTVKDIRFNPSLPDKVFSMAPPAGVQVTDRTDDLIQRMKEMSGK